MIVFLIDYARLANVLVYKYQHLSQFFWHFQRILHRIGLQEFSSAYAVVPSQSMLSFVLLDSFSK